ncbi:tetratricopeptide repeat protein [Streptomyces massasporeus]|uniref:Tetratricopeptide repeat protein n=1 Tax=Streptomyces massasporeus TaxID=67324 RepID=A0ABW6LR75_9ACTN
MTTAARERPPWLVSVRRSRTGDPVGAGLLCLPGHILTCAHVVQDDMGPEPPTGPLYVQFQYAPGAGPLRATVVPRLWHPADPDNTGDVAVLRLLDEAPPQARPAPLLRTSESGVWDHRFRTYGYPRGHEARGVPVRGEIIDYAESEWLQLEASPQAGWALEGGFSGAPVWDVEADGVVGMLITRDRVGKKDLRTAYAVLTDALPRYWPELAPHIGDSVSGRTRERLEELLALPLTEDGQLPRVADTAALDIGVSPSKYGTDTSLAPYVRRNPQDQLLEETLDASGFVLLVGPSKAGKSRTMYELLRRVRNGARLIVPKAERSVLDDLTRLALPAGDDRAILWLDDLHHHLRPGGFDLKVLDRCARHEPPIAVVATISAQQRDALIGLDSDVGRTARAILARARHVELSDGLSPHDHAEAQRLYPAEDFSERGIGEQMIAAPSLEQRLADGFAHFPPGWAVTRAAADWQRMGVEGPAPESVVRTLFQSYLDALQPPYRPSQDTRGSTFEDAVRWAGEPVAGDIALIYERALPEGRPGFDTFAYIAEYLDAHGDESFAGMPAFAWECAEAAVDDAQLLSLAYGALVRGEVETAERVLQRALRSGPGADSAGETDSASDTDARGGTDPGRGTAAWAALMLGEVRLYQNRFDEAVELLERAAATGPEDTVPLAQVELASALAMAGDRARARALMEVNLDSRDPQIAQMARAGLGGLLIADGEHERAQELLEAAVASDDDEATAMARAHLGKLLVDEGETTGVHSVPPRGAAARADTAPGARRGDDPVGAGARQWDLPRAVGESVTNQISAVARANLGNLLVNQGKLERGEELLRSVLADGEPHAGQLAAVALADLLIRQERLEEARESLEAVVASEHPVMVPFAKVSLGLVELNTGHYETGEEILREVYDSGHPDQAPRAACVLGQWHISQDRPDTGREWLGRALNFGNDGWDGVALISLAVITEDLQESRRLLERVIEAGYWETLPPAADLLGDLLAGQGDTAGAEAAYRTAIETDHNHWAPVARMDLAVMLVRSQDDRAVAMLTELMASDNPELVPRAADLLGDLHQENGDWDAAETAYRVAIASGHELWGVTAQVDLAIMLADNGHEAGAEVLLRQVTTSRHPIAASWGMTLLGILLVIEGRETEGRVQLSRAISANCPETAPLARFRLAKCHADAGEREPGAELLREILAAPADNPTVTAVAQAYLGAMLLQDGQVDAADELFTDAELSGSSEALAYACLSKGEYLLEMGEVEAARELLEAAIATGEEEIVPCAGAILGIVRLAANEFTEARELLERALEWGDPSMEAMSRRYLGGALYRLGDLAGAESVLTPLAEDEGPDDTEYRAHARLLLAQICSLGGRDEQAVAWCDRVIGAGDPEVEETARRLRAELLLRTGVPGSPGMPSSWPSPPPTGRAAAPPQVALEPALPAVVVAYLGEIAAAEGERAEARYWFERALHSADLKTRELAAARLAVLDTAAGGEPGGHVD